MKGIILASGAGTRLYPVTKAMSKQLVPIYDKPMIYYPMSVLMLAGIRDILIISTERDSSAFKELFKNGTDLGLNIVYEIQENQNGLAEAFIIGEEFIGQDNVAMILGDNILYGQGFSNTLKEIIEIEEGAVIFGYYVQNAKEFGVVEVDKNGMAVSIEEKSEKPKSKYAVPGLYFYDNTVIAKAKALKSSVRGELGIVDLNRLYIDEGKLKVNLLGRGLAWLNTGTHAAMLQASNFVEAVQNTQGTYIACLEEIAYRQGWISRENVKELAKPLMKTEYGKYLKDIIEENIDEDISKVNIDTENKKSKSLKILQVVPNNMVIPPKNYGAVERIAYDLTENLIRQGHEVYIFARKGSRTSGKIIEFPNNNMLQTEFILENIPKDIDIIHDHTVESLVGKRNLEIPTVCTIHDNLFNNVKYPVFVSKRAREILGEGKGYYVYNSININDYEFSEEKEDYLYFTGAWAEKKGLKLALEVAKVTGEKIKISGPIHDWGYFVNELKDSIDSNPNVIPLGVVGGQERIDLYKKAKCVLFPSIWEEPFGLVMIEAMACGTPVLALKNGAVPEVMKGFPDLICNTVEEMIEKVKLNNFPKPKELRDYVVNNFSLEKMIQGYLDIYYEVLEKENKL